MDDVRHAVWRMLYADNACIVSRSSQGLAKMMVIVVVCRAFALTVSAKKIEHSASLHRVHRGRWCESKRPGKSTNSAISNLPSGRRDRNPGHVR